MIENKDVFVIGHHEIVNLFKFIGIRGKIIEKVEGFNQEFQKVLSHQSIGLLIVALSLPDKKVQDILDEKIDRRSPLIFYFPIASMNQIDRDPVYSKIEDSIKHIIALN